jgi:raffinose/stachyose/melibiose transport system substrate-binding protein
MHNFKTGRARGLLTAGALCAALAAAATGCSGLTPGDSSSESSPVSGKKLSEADVRNAGTINLTLSDAQFGPLLEALEKNIAAFERKFPNITIVNTEKSYADYDKTIALSMSSKGAPDIAMATNVEARRLVSGKLVKPLDSYFTAYDWGHDLSKGLVDGLRLSSNGKVFGEGTYWGVPLGGNVVGLYYNKALLNQLGVEAPTTFDDLVADMAKAKAAGIQPLEIGNLDQWPASHVASALLDTFAKADAVNNWVNGQPGSTIDTPAAVESLKTLQGWVTAGYISSQVNGIKETDAEANFAAGKALFQVVGSWQTPTYDEALGDKVGFMLVPSKANKAAGTGGISEGWVISSKSKNADIAAYFLDFMAGPECLENNINGGYLPFAPDAKAPGGPVMQQVFDAWDAALQADGVTAWLDWATPSMGPTEFSAIQSLLAGKQSPDDVVEAMQENWDSYYKSGS